MNSGFRKGLCIFSSGGSGRRGLLLPVAYIANWARRMRALSSSLWLRAAIFIQGLVMPWHALQIWWLAYVLDIYSARADAGRRAAHRAERKIARYARLYERALRRARERT